MKEIIRYHHCFVCGEGNVNGLKARFYYDGQKAITEVEAATVFEGYPGIFHGGITSTILDEVMIKAILAIDVYAVTAEMTVKFKRPVRVGDKLTFTGWIVKNRGRIYLTKGEVVDSLGNQLATSSGKYIVAKDDLRAELTKANSARA